MNAFIKYMVDRLKERSTWTGVALLATAIGVELNPDKMAKLIEHGAEAVGLIYMITKDNTDK
jgi:hypothetical protein